MDVLEDQIIELKAELVKAKKITERQNRERSFYNSNKDTRQRRRGTQSVEFQRQTSNPPFGEYDFMNMYNANRTPAPTATSANAGTNILTITKGMNKRWPDVELFYSTHDRKNQRQWRINLMTKFRQSIVFYPTEQSKINYIRLKLRDVTLGVVQTRADHDGDNSYNTHAEIIIDLENFFGDFDKITIYNVIIHDPNFKMGYSKNKTFDEYHIRFIIRIGLLTYMLDI